VVRLLDHRAARRDQRRVRGQGLGQADVQPGLRPGQHLPQDRLADQRVPEGIPVSLRDQHVRRHRQPQRGEQLPVADSGDRGQQPVPAPLPGHRQRLQHLLGLRGQALHVGQHEVAQRLRQVGGGALVAPQQRLQEQRVALAAPEHPLGQLRSGLAAQQAGRELTSLTAGQPGQVQPRHPAEPAQLG
jgi:hypothetical protein